MRVCAFVPERVPCEGVMTVHATWPSSHDGSVLCGKPRVRVEGDRVQILTPSDWDLVTCDVCAYVATGDRT